jgi:hypothetical protein
MSSSRAEMNSRTPCASATRSSPSPLTLDFVGILFDSVCNGPSVWGSHSPYLPLAIFLADRLRCRRRCNKEPRPDSTHDVSELRDSAFHDVWGEVIALFFHAIYSAVMNKCSLYVSQGPSTQPSSATAQESVIARQVPIATGSRVMSPRDPSTRPSSATAQESLPQSHLADS